MTRTSRGTVTWQRLDPQPPVASAWNRRRAERSSLCCQGGLSHSMAQLIAFRAVQGLGAGGLMVGVIAAIGDLVPPRERGQYVGYIMGVVMIAMITGPLVGGTITDHFSWRWIFYINLPVGGAALIYLTAVLHTPPRRVRHRIDYPGAALLAVAATALVLLTSWGGTQYPWGSPEIISLAAVAGVTMIAFVAVESRAADDGRRRCHLDCLWAGDYPHRPLQGVPHTRWRRNGRGHVPAFPAWRRDQPNDLRALHDRARRRHGAAHADHHAHRAEQRRPA